MTPADKFAAFDAALRARLTANAAALTTQKKTKQRLDEQKALLLAKRRLLARNISGRDALLEVGGLTGNIEHDEALLARLRDDNNWQPLAIVVVGQYQHCSNCGSRNTATSGFFMREKHKTFVSAVRMRALKTLPDGYPLEMALEGVILPRCVECAGDHTYQSPANNIVDDLLAACVRDTPPGFSNQLTLELH